ncbi:hypothetical protein [Nocardia arthritidis]|uniref:PH domain-containing protein n=1 Tax=Nocardia arthritidis TaxID=228602 RepID=A0A6G9YMD7_9NOCA|nr:hypothetical protein [Nocardia arthritidis]QIS14351.1 hypothetical protein F5544_32570 [Nocardia arthritidis]
MVAGLDGRSEGMHIRPFIPNLSTAVRSTYPHTNVLPAQGIAGSGWWRFVITVQIVVHSKEKPTSFRASSRIHVFMVVAGVVAVIALVLLQVSMPGPPVPVSGIAVGVFVALVGSSYLLDRSPDVLVDDNAVTVRPFGRIPWEAISRVHLVRVGVPADRTRYLAIELAGRTPKLDERRWPRMIYGPINRLTTGHRICVSERLVRPVSLDDIVSELQRRRPDLVVIRSERGWLRWILWFL